MDNDAEILHPLSRGYFANIGESMCLRAFVHTCVNPCSHVNDEYVSAESPSRGRDPQPEYTTGTDAAYSQTMSIAQG